MEHINNYLPKDDSEKLFWLKNFIDKLHEYANSFDLTSSDTILIEQDIQKFRSLLRIKIEYQHGQSLYGLRGPMNVDFPVTSRSQNKTIQSSASMPGYLLKKLAHTVKGLKGHPSYSEALGMDLGLIRVTNAQQGSPNCTNINNSIHINRRRKFRDYVH